jgi:hypothetical protein
VVSPVLQLSAAATGPYVGKVCSQKLQCGSMSYPWCLVSQGINHVDPALWPQGVLVSPGDFQEPASVQMRSGVDVTGGYDFLTGQPTLFKPTTAPDDAHTSISFLSPAGVVHWPAGVNATLSNLQVKPASDATGAIQIDSGGAKLSGVLVDARSPSMDPLPTAPSSFTGVLVSAGANGGSLSLDNCAVNTPNVSCSNDMFCSNKAVRVKGAGSFGVKITGGAYSVGDTSSLNQSPQESVGIESLLEMGALEVTDATVTSGSTVSGVSVGIRAASGNGVSLLGTTVIGGGKTNLSPVTDAVRLGVDLAESNGGPSFSIPATSTIQGNLTLGPNTGPSIFQVLQVAAGGAGRAVAFFGGLQHYAFLLEGSSLQGPGSPVPLAGRAIGLFVDGQLTPPATGSTVMIDNSKSPGVIVGGWASQQQIGALLNDVVFSGVQANVLGTPTSLSMGMVTAPAGGETKGLVVRQQGLNASQVTFSGVAAGGLADGKQGGGQLMEVVGIEVDTTGVLAIDQASVTGCVGDCPGQNAGDRAVGVRLLSASSATVLRSTLAGGNLLSGPLPLAVGHPISAGVLVEPTASSHGLSGPVRIEDNPFIGAGQSVASYGVVVVNLQGPANWSPPTLSIQRNFVSPGGSNALSNPTMCVIKSMVQPCKSLGMDLLASPDSLVVNNVALSGVGDFFQAFRLNATNLSTDLLIAFNLFASQGNAGPAVDYCMPALGTYGKLVNLEGSVATNFMPRLFFAGNLLVPSGPSMMREDLISLSSTFLSPMDLQNQVFQPEKNQIAPADPGVLLREICWNDTACCNGKNNPTASTLDTGDTSLQKSQTSEFTKFVDKAGQLSPGNPMGIQGVPFYTSSCSSYLEALGVLSVSNFAAYPPSWQGSLLVDFNNNARPMGALPTGPFVCH